MIMLQHKRVRQGSRCDHSKYGILSYEYVGCPSPSKALFRETKFTGSEVQNQLHFLNIYCCCGRSTNGWKVWLRIGFGNLIKLTSIRVMNASRTGLKFIPACEVYYNDCGLQSSIRNPR